ncbi:planarian mariner-8 gene [Nephila pilipes]|uniref:Planarian mariner-8 protein n=1 Tax=Nephila pilipes TaxID=299642 RepID=A0A8X6R3K1_NEPPI|nr:planarian mariner-8 gene [Nephila pilipes]
MKYEFHRGATTRQAAANINNVFGIQVATNATVARWLKKFRSRDFDLSIEPCGRLKTQVDNDILKATVEANCSQSTRQTYEPPEHCPKRDIHQKKLMVTVWWSDSAVIHHSFMEPGQSITANVYCYQLDEMMRNLAKIS